MKYEIRGAASAGTVRLEGRTLHGTAIPYNSDSLDLGGFIERFAPGSVTEAIAGGQIEAWTYHDRTKPLGSQAAGTLRLTDTPQGLLYECDLPDTSYANDLRAMMSRPNGKSDIGGTSFGFAPAPDGQQWKREGGNNVRTITKAFIDHVSPVVTPAYPTTSASLRSFSAADIDMADAYGIDLNKLAKIFIAVRKGLSIDSDERDIAKQAISQLRNLKCLTPKLKEAEALASKYLL
jgi:HK97 family phage prohead protease